MFQKLKTKAAVKLMKHQMNKQGVTGPQQQMLLDLLENNPELFEKMAKEIESLKKQGKGDMAAAMQVFKKYQTELHGVAGKK